MLTVPFPDDFDDVLRSSDPLSDTLLETPQIEAAFNELGENLLRVPMPLSRARTRTKRRLTRRMFTVALASLLVVGVAGAASVVVSARTGQKVPKQYVAAGGPGEELGHGRPTFAKSPFQSRPTSNIPRATQTGDCKSWHLRTTFRIQARRVRVRSRLQGERQSHGRSRCQREPKGDSLR